MASMTGTAAEERTSCCARCGYDLRGTVAAWTDACPLEGRCTECGFTFEWADVFTPARNTPAWCVEHVSKRRILRGCFGTLLRSFAPWSFWTQLKLAHPVRPGRLLMYVAIIVILPILIGYITTQAATAIMVRAQMPVYLAHAAQQSAGLHQSYLQRRQDWNDVRNLDAAIQADVAIPVGVQRTKAAADFDSQNEWDEAWQAYADWLDMVLQGYQNAAEQTTTIHMSYPVAVVEATLFPLSDSSWGTVAWGDDMEAYPAPADLYDTLSMFKYVQSTQSSPVRFRGFDQIESVASGAALILLSYLPFLVILPGTFILLPITRRRARVRWRHFGRITAYSVFIPAVVAWMCAAAIAIYLFLPQLTIMTTGLILVMAALLPPPMIMAWWYVAVKRHLLLPRPLLIVIVLSVVAMLIMLALYTWTARVLG